ncbi:MULTISPECIES: VaFE repeat-containing surface-anchored protein [unclassified Corynebacterium]|uniref:VaFE repeat-containing surface-anchored protein n=1 Tax=unclassified Corynebacterium TaxID=2624378 RepID=UPI0029CA3D59|nr:MULTISPECIES: VaFE repeat-containing surface-anchored protein [unclassified Corynebacterium]WPF66332.1 VaFE repeat-containing surface-anchored protein [Corynebacterium sp. 22KM0430]WPF68822.1 VaFE repeat-containing surface-anchored protein [Corynebacterium sp. 21KM1197]
MVKKTISTFGISKAVKRVIAFFAALVIAVSGSTSVANALDYGEEFFLDPQRSMYPTSGMRVDGEDVPLGTGLDPLLQTRSGEAIPNIYAYCVEYQIFVKDSSAKAFTWTEYNDKVRSENLKNQDNREKINWILHNAYPMLPEKELAEKAGLPNLSKAHAVAATQLAIWKFSDGLDANERVKGVPPNVLKAYDYLTGPDNTGRKESTSGNNRTGAYVVPDDKDGQHMVIVDVDSDPEPEPTPGPESEESTTPEETPEVTERPAPKNPKISTSAEFAEGANQVVAGATVNDAVTYEDLVPGKQYTLEASLVDKADESKVVGSGSQSFTADESGNGSVVVPIKVSDDVAEPVAAAVAFETLKSDDDEAQANKAEDLPEGSAPDVIAEHKDINDEAQTVESAEDQQAKIELKKYIGTEEFAGSEKPQGQPGADGVVDAQTADEAFAAKAAGDDLTVTFAVTNTGALNLKDVSVADALMDSDTAGIDPGTVSPEKQDIAVGETKYFTAKIAAPEAGKLHADQAKAEGTPVDEQGNEVPFVDEDGNRQEPGSRVPSNEDPAHAVTPESKTADVELKKYIGAKAENADSLSVAEAEALNDSQTEDTAHEAAQADEDLTVAFVVENTGQLDLADVKVSDEAIKAAFKNAVDGTEAGLDADTPQVSNIRAVDAEKQKLLKVGEKMVFVGDLKAPAAGKLHADKAKTTGTPVDEKGEPTGYAPVDENGKPVVDEQGNPVVNEPGTPVESEEDQAHATTPEDQSAKIELKKYIGAKTDITSVSQAEGLNDSQTEDAAHEAAKADEDLTVAFVVENTGELALKDIQNPSDEAIKEAFTNALDGTVSGVDADTAQVTNIKVADFADNADKQRLLKSGDKVVFVGDLKAPAAGKLHADKAKSTGVPVDESGEPVEYTPVDADGKPVADEQGNPVINKAETPVESNEDPAHARTPEKPEPEIETVAKFKDAEYNVVIADNVIVDTVKYSGLVPGKSYDVTAELVNKADGAVIGEGSATFTAEDSGSGSTEVELTVNADVEEPVASAVVFETLTSSDAEALEAKASDEVLDGEDAAKGAIKQLPKSVDRPSVIAVHHDIEDTKQTVETDDSKVKPKPRPSESVVPSDQPVNPQPNPEDEPSDAPKPTSEQTSAPEPTSTVTSEPATPGEPATEEPAEPTDLKPSVTTSVDPKAVDEIVPGGKVVDKVSYQGLKPNTEYTLQAEMRDKDNEDRVIGSGEKTFTTPNSDAESVSGTVDVDITFNANATDVKSAVAFEELTSMVVDAKGNPTPDASVPNVIAEHKDINDAAQTVSTREKPEPGEPKLELKKYINDNDAQDWNTAEQLKPGEKATVKFVVKNTGEVDLFNVTLSDETVEGVGDVVNITPDQIDRLNVGESGEFTGELTLPESNQNHKDVAKAEGVPPNPENPDEPGLDQPKVPSNEDPAHAETPGEGEPKLALKKYINGEDSQTANEAVEASKAGDELEVTFVVKNVGDVNVFNVTVEDNLLENDESGVKVDDPKPATDEDAKKAERLAPGEEVTFKGTIPAPEAGKLHADEAKAKGVGPNPENPNEPGDKPVESNEDPAHAKTPKPGEPVVPVPPKPGEPEPKITTDAAIEGNGPLVAGATVVDTVSFTGLKVGQRYELEAALMCKASGESTGATAKVAFVPQVADGQINVPISVTDANCSEQVAFETLRDKSGDVVAVHHDINDAAQTVTAEDVTKPAPSPETVEKKRDRNVTVVSEGAPEVGKAVAPKTPRRSIKAIPSGSLVLEEGMPSRI